MKKRITICLAVIVIIVAVSITGGYMYNLSPENPDLSLIVTEIVIEEVLPDEVYYFPQGPELHSISIEQNMVDDILSHPENYRLLTLGYDIANLSESIISKDISAYPIFTEDLQERVLGTGKILSEYLQLDPEQAFSFTQRVLIKSNGFTDEGILVMAQVGKIEVSYFTGSQFLYWSNWSTPNNVHRNRFRKSKLSHADFSPACGAGGR